MTVRLLASSLGGALLLSVSALCHAGATSLTSDAYLQGIDLQIDRLERDCRRIAETRAGASAAPAESALAELARLRRELDSWLARRDIEPYASNLERFLRNLEMRLARLGARARTPLSGPPPERSLRTKVQGADRPAARSAATETLAPANDDCAAALVIGDGSFAGDTTAATSDGEASCGASVPGPDVWFHYVAPASGDVMFNTFGSGFDTVLSLHSGCPGTSANELACNDDDEGVQSSLTRSLDMGDEVLVRIGGFAGDYGAFQLAVGRPAEIVGTVTGSASGLGLEDVSIRVYDAYGSWQGSTSTSASGAYSLTGLRQAVYYVKASHSAYQAEIYDDVECPDYCDPTTGTAIPVGLGEIAQADFALDRAGAIEGVVTDAQSGDPVEGVPVTLYTNGGGWAGSDVSAADGSYAVVGLEPGGYFARAEHNGVYLGELFDDIDCPFSCDPTTGTVIPVALGAPARADFSLERGGTITGRITEAVTGQPVDGQVGVVDQTGQVSGATSADDDGRFVHSGLPSGTYFAVASEWRYLDQLYDGLDCASGCDATTGTPIAVTLGNETAGVDFSLLREAAFSGIVVDDASGTWVNDVVVDAWDDQGEWAGSGYSDFGAYVVGGLPGGIYFAATSNYTHGYLDELYDDLPCIDGGCDPTTGTPIAVAPAVTTPGIDFALRLGGWISGSVVEVAQGSELRGRARLWDLGGNELQDPFFSDGSYLIRGLTTGTYFVSVDAWSAYHDELYDDIPCTSGCDPLSGTPVAVTAGSETAGIDFALCGQPGLLAQFPPSGNPDSFIDGCRVQIDGYTSSYAPGCPPVQRIYWEWGDGKEGNADFPATHMYEPGHERVTVMATAWDALGLDSEDVRKELWLWDCLTPGACGYPDDRDLYNLQLDSTELIRACSTITLGPGLNVVDPGDVAFVAGDTITLDGVRFEGGRVRIETDPALLP